MSNPFKYGKVVDKEHFVDRDKEIEEIKKHLRSGKSVILYSPRGTGKTSLIQKVFGEIGNEYITATIDMFQTPSKEKLAKNIVQNLTNETFNTIDAFKNKLEGFIKKLRFDIVLTKEGEIRLEPSTEAGQDELEKVLDFPERIGEEKEQKVVLCFDEFQEIAELDGEEMEKLMRSKFQNHDHVVYIFTGSQSHLIEEIFGQERRAFYKFGRPIELGPIPREDLQEYITKRFGSENGNIAGEAVEKILDTTRCHPSFTQQLCYEVWNLSENADKSKVEKAIETIIDHEEAHYQTILKERTPLRRRLLKGLAEQGSKAKPYSQKFRKKYDLRSPGNISKSLKKLKETGIVKENNEIWDVFFREYLKRRYTF